MHRARNENPDYFDTLKDLANVSEAIVAPPVTEDEINTWHQGLVALESQEKVMRAIGCASWLTTQSLAQLPDPERAVVTSELFDTFSVDSIGYRSMLEQLRNNYDAQDSIDPIRNTEKVLLYKDGNYLRFLPDWPHALAYHGALTTITNRFRSEEAQLQATLALGEEAQHELFVRVQRRTKGIMPKRAALNTFIEGFDSIAFAGAHLELGGATGLAHRERFAQAILSYTAIIPGSGLLAPMALRGQYFADFTDVDGQINPIHQSVFRQYREQSAQQGSSAVEDEIEELDTQSPYDPEYCNNFGFPMKLNPANKPTPDYQGEGCPGVYDRLVYNSAHQFAQKVTYFDGLRPPKLQQLCLDQVIQLARTQTAMLR